METTTQAIKPTESNIDVIGFDTVQGFILFILAVFIIGAILGGWVVTQIVKVSSRVYNNRVL